MLSELGESAPVKVQRRRFDRSASRGLVKEEPLGAPRKVPGLSFGGLLWPIAPRGRSVDDAPDDACGSPCLSPDISREEMVASEAGRRYFTCR